MKCPYVGLTPYSRSEAQFFFGRDEECEVVALNLLSSELTLVYGPSGAGKSSVLGAGVEGRLMAEAAARLVRGERPESLPLTFKSWQQDPLAGIGARIGEAVAEVKAAALAALRPAPGGTADPGAADFIAGYGEGLDVPPGRLVDVIESCAAQLGCTLLVILDQFEEFFFYQGGGAARKRFVAELAEAINEAGKEHGARPEENGDGPPPPRYRWIVCNFLISIREDALARLDLMESYVPNLFQNKYPIRRLTREQAEQAIRGPVDKYNELYRKGAPPIQLDRGLTKAVLDGIQTGGAARATPADEEEAAGFEAPLLQLIMQRIWNASAQEAGGLRAEILEGMGGVEHLVEGHVRQTIEALKPRQRAAVARVFSHLVTPTGNRNAQRLTDLKDWTRDLKVPVEPLLERLCKEPARILTPMSLPARASGEDKYYQISHDVLAPAVLSWRVGYERAEFEQQLREENRAKYQAYSRELAAASVNNLTLDPELSLLLALYATQVGERSGSRATEESEEALLRALQASRVRATMYGHDARLCAAAFDREGRRLVTASEDGTAVCWDARTGARLKVFRGHAGWVLAASFSPDGKQIITAGEDGTVRVWCVDARHPPKEFKLSDEAVNYVAFDDAGARFAAAGEEGKVWIQGVDGGKPLVLSGHAGSVDAVAFGPDGRLVASAGEDAVVRLWDARNGRQVSKLPGHHDRIKAVVFGRSGALLATGSHDGTAIVWSLAERKAISTIAVGNYWITSVDLSPDEGRLITPGKVKNTAAVWDVRSAQPLLTLLGHESEVRGVAFSPDGERAATASLDGTAKVWHVAENGRLILQTHDDEVKSVAFSPDGSVIATGSNDQTAKLWDASTGRLLHAFDDHRGDVSGLAFSPDGRLLATVGWDGAARLWDVASGKLLLEQGRGEHLLAVAFSPGGNYLATSGTDKTCVVWQLAEGRRGLNLKPRCRMRGHAKWVNAVAYSPDGRLLATSSDDKTLRVWDAETGRELYRLAGSDFFQGVAFARPARRPILLGSSHDGSAVVWDFSAKRETCRRLTGHAKALHHVSASPDGRLAATASEDCTVRVWDLASGDALAVMKGHAGAVWNASFSPDGERVATASLDRTARVWDVRTHEERLVLNNSEKYGKVYRPDPDTRMYGLDLASMQEMAARHLTRSFTEKECRKYLHLNNCRDIPDPRRLAAGRKA